MKNYQVQIKNHYVVSVKVTISAKNEFEASIKAREIFKFNGKDKSIVVEQV